MPLSDKMNRDYKVSNDGTIFEIREDGSIAKIARIDEKGNISSINGNVNKQQGGKDKYWFLIILFIVTTAIMGVELSESNSVINDVAEEYPIIIKDIEIGNVYKDGDIETDYGERIYDYNTMYLKPRIRYIGLESGMKTFKVKWYTPSGFLSRGDSSPSGFSLADDKNVSKGNNTLTLSGWGNDSKGNWRGGTYRIEVWYENTCLKTKTFNIY